MCRVRSVLFFVYVYYICFMFHSFSTLGILWRHCFGKQDLNRKIRCVAGDWNQLACFLKLVNREADRTLRRCLPPRTLTEILFHVEAASCLYSDTRNCFCSKHNLPVSNGGCFLELHSIFNGEQRINPFGICHP